MVDLGFRGSHPGNSVGEEVNQMQHVDAWCQKG